MMKTKQEATTKVAILGSGEYYFLDAVRATVENVAADHDDVVILTGDSGEVCRTVAEHAADIGADFAVIEANATEFGDVAADVRNIRIISIADKVTIFWNGEDAETRTALKECMTEMEPDDYNIHLERENIVPKVKQVDEEADKVSYTALDDWIAQHTENDKEDK